VTASSSSSRTLDSSVGSLASSQFSAFDLDKATTIVMIETGGGRADVR
jgi:hypothetical protein